MSDRLAPGMDIGETREGETAEGELVCAPSRLLAEPGGESEKEGEVGRGTSGERLRRLLRTPSVSSATELSSLREGGVDPRCLYGWYEPEKDCDSWV